MSQDGLVAQCLNAVFWNGRLIPCIFPMKHIIPCSFWTAKELDINGTISALRTVLDVLRATDVEYDVLIQELKIPTPPIVPLTGHLGRAVKCLDRAVTKDNRIGDLKKARWHIKQEMKRLMS